VIQQGVLTVSEGVVVTEGVGAVVTKGLDPVEGAVVATPTAGVKAFLKVINATEESLPTAVVVSGKRRGKISRLKKVGYMEVRAPSTSSPKRADNLCVTRSATSVGASIGNGVKPIKVDDHGALTNRVAKKVMKQVDKGWEERQRQPARKKR
jgi:hypothetical protein